MTQPIDPTKMRLAKTVVQNQAGFWCAALDAGGKRLFAGATDFQIHTYDLPAVTPSKLGPLKGHGSYATALAYLPASGVLISGSFDKELLWWKPAAGATPSRRVMVGSRINRLAASADGGFVATATEDLIGRIWEVATGKLAVQLLGGHPPTTTIGRRNTLYAVAFSPDGRTVATGDRAGTICLWESASGKRLLQCQAGAFYSQAMQQPPKLASEYEWGGVRSLAFSPDGKLLVAGGMGPADQNSAGIDGPMRLEAFDPATGKSVAVFMNTAKGMLTTLFFHPAGDWVVAGGGGGKAGSSGIGSLWLWPYRQRGKDGKLLLPMPQQTAIVVREVLPNLDGTGLLAVGMLNDVTAGRIEVWDWTPNSPQRAQRENKKGNK
jgi:WD40 repeat protein